ncbi:MAG: hypothetical protein KAJ44_06670, partial [Thermoplasmatales archaeon]|nr:hypothetical protein [Thermoplasmatales archaeon]
MSIKNSIKITALRTINTIYELSRVVTVCFIKLLLRYNGRNLKISLIFSTIRSTKNSIMSTDRKSIIH